MGEVGFAPRANFRMSQDSRVEGFSTLEALVAVGLLGLVLAPLYQLQSSLAVGAAATERRLAALEGQERAETILAALPPDVLKTGRLRIDGLDLQWTLVEVAPERQSLSEDGLEGRFGVRLVAIDYIAARDGAEPVSGRITRLDWRANRSFFDP